MACSVCWGTAISFISGLMYLIWVFPLIGGVGGGAGRCCRRRRHRIAAAKRCGVVETQHPTMNTLFFALREDVRRRLLLPIFGFVSL